MSMKLWIFIYSKKMNESQLFRFGGINDWKNGRWSWIHVFGVSKSSASQRKSEEAHCQHAHWRKPTGVYNLWEIIQESELLAKPHKHPSQRTGSFSFLNFFKVPYKGC